jgi:predicted ABC-type exoprotein transport system permease subunit
LIIDARRGDWEASQSETIAFEQAKATSHLRFDIIFTDFNHISQGRG